MNVALVSVFYVMKETFGHGFEALEILLLFFSTWSSTGLSVFPWLGLRISVCSSEISFS